MTAPDLLPCPFCGEAPRLWEYNKGECEIECINGHCPSEPHVGIHTKAEAIAAWNTRATPAAMTPEVAKLVDAVAVLLMQHDFENPMRQADYHGDICQCRRCRMDAVRAAIAALRAGGDA